MLNEIERKSLEANQFLPYPIIPFVKIKGKDYRCDEHKNLKMNRGTIKSHIRKTHKLNFEKGTPLTITEEHLPNFTVEKIPSDPVKIMMEAQEKHFWKIFKIAKAISRIKDPKYAKLVVKHGLFGKIKEDFLKILEGKSNEISMKKIDRFWTKKNEQKYILNKTEDILDSVFSKRRIQQNDRFSSRYP